MPQEVYQHTFANGFTLLAERMEHVRSAAMYFLVPSGCAYDPPDQLGLAGVLAELITRGAGNRDSSRADARPGQPGAGPQRERGHHAHALLGHHHRPQPAGRPGDLCRHPPPAAPARGGTGAGAGAGLAGHLWPGGRARLARHGRAAQAPLPRPPEQRPSRHHRRRRGHHSRVGAQAPREVFPSPGARFCRWPATSSGRRCATRWNASSATGTAARTAASRSAPPPAGAPTCPRSWSRRRSPSPIPACRWAIPITTSHWGR